MNLHTKEPAMLAVKLGASCQAAIPQKIHDQLRLHPRDYLEIEINLGKRILPPQTLIDSRLKESLTNLKEGRIFSFSLFRAPWYTH